jgi:phosphatidate cytidylyltransferase
MSAPPVGGPPATAEEEAARAVARLMDSFPAAEPVPEAVEAAPPPWAPPGPEAAPTAAEEVEEELPAAAAGPEEEAQADEWLAFVEGAAPSGPPSVPAPAVTAPVATPSEEGEEEAAAGPEAPLKARRRLFGRRGRAPVAEEPSLEAAEEETGGEGAAAAEVELPSAAAEVAVEAEHRPPPWAPPETGLPASAGAAAAAAAPGPLLAGGEGAGWVPVPPAGPPPTAPPEAAVRPAAEPVPSTPAEPPRPLHLWEPAEELPSDVEEEEEVEEWAGDAGALPASWFAEIDEDQVAVPPARLPEEEAPEDEEAWEAWPLPPAAPGAAHPEEAAGRAAPEPEPLAGKEELEAAGWEEFPKPGRPVPRVESAPAAPPTEAAWGYPQGGEPEGGEGEEAWPAESEEAWAEEGWEQPVPGASVGEPTEEVAAPGVYDFEGRRQGPISEEVVAGAVTMEHRGLAEEIAAADTAETELQALSAPMAGLDSGVVGFEDVVHLGGDEEFVAPRRSDMGLRVMTGMLLAALLLGAMWVGGEFLAGFIGLLVIIGLGEFYGTLRRHGYQPLALFGFLGGVGILVGTWFYGLVAIPVAVVATTVLTFFYYAFAPRRRDALTNGGLTVLGLLWVTGTAAFAYPIAAADDFQVLVLAIVAAVVATDIGALAAGRAWGSRPLAPVLSPQKTVEGLAGGVVLGIAVAVVAGWFLRPLDVRSGAALGLIVALMAPLGDLAESMLKRSLGVKDMGATLPGHGGILDRIDAFLFVLPAAWVLYETLGLLH